MEVLRFGYRVPFLSTPPLSDVPIPLPSYSPSSIRGIALTAAVADLREKGAIELAPPPPGNYSRLFVTPKVTWGWRPVIDLSRLNRSVRVFHFHMETQQSVLQSLRPGDWMASLDLKDTYLQVPVHPESRCYLRFCVEEEVWQFRALCFGLSTALQAFTRVMAPIPSIMHRHGFWILRYLDDWRVLVSGPGSGEGLPSLALSGARCPGQSGEEFSDSLSDFGLPGDAASDTSFEGFPDPQTCPEAWLSAYRIHLISAAASDSVASAPGGHIFSGIHRSRVPPPGAFASAPAEFRRSPPGGFGQRGLGFLLPRGSSIVVRRLPSSRRSSYFA